MLLSTDNKGTQVIPQAPYTNANGLWIPAPTDESGNPYTKLTGSSAIYAGTSSLSTTTTQLPNQASSEVLIQSDPANTVSIGIGTSSLQPIQLAPGQSMTLSISNLNLLYAIALSNTATLNWMVRS